MPNHMSRNIDLILVPWDSGHRGKRTGAGPEALVEGGLRTRLEQRGHDVRVVIVEPPPAALHAEIATAFGLAARIAVAVRTASLAQRFPLILAGNCATSIGVVAALGAGTPVVWADAHGDFNTPETTIGGFLDGMSLATIAGRCWTQLTARIPGFAPVSEQRVWLLGARDLDPLELDALSHSPIRRVAPGQVDERTANEIVKEIGAVPAYLHLDLDVIDPSEGRVNQFAADGGVSVANLAEFVATLSASARLGAVTISAYDPSVDQDGRARESALRVIEALFR